MDWPAHGSFWSHFTIRARVNAGTIITETIIFRSCIHYSNRSLNLYFIVLCFLDSDRFLEVVFYIKILINHRLDKSSKLDMTPAGTRRPFTFVRSWTITSERDYGSTAGSRCRGALCRSCHRHLPLVNVRREDKIVEIANKKCSCLKEREGEVNLE